MAGEAVGESGSISGTGGIWLFGLQVLVQSMTSSLFWYSDGFSIILFIVLFRSFSSIECRTIRLVGWSRVWRMVAKVLLLTREFPFSCISVFMTDCGAEGGWVCIPLLTWDTVAAGAAVTCATWVCLIVSSHSVFTFLFLESIKFLYFM